MREGGYFVSSKFSQRHQLYLENVLLEKSGKKRDSYFVFHGQCMVLGDSGVGKTSLIKSLTGEEFDPNETKTLGVEESLVDQQWKHFSMKDFVLGDLWRFYTFGLRAFQVLSITGGEATGSTNFVVRGFFLSTFECIPFLFTGIYMVILLMYCNYQTAVPILFFSFINFIAMILHPILLTLYRTSDQLHVRCTLAKFNYIFSGRGLLMGSYLALVIRHIWYGSNADILSSRGKLFLATVPITAIFSLFLSIIGPFGDYLKYFIQHLLQLQLYLSRLLLSVFIGFTFGIVALSFVPVSLDPSPDFYLRLPYFASLPLSFCSDLLFLCLLHVHEEDIVGLISLCIVLGFYHSRLIWSFGPFYFVMLFPVSILFTFYMEVVVPYSMVPINSEHSETVTVVFEGAAHIDCQMLKSAMIEKFSSLKLKILDFAGDKEYYAYHHLFFRPHAIYLIVLNIAEFVENDFKDINAGVQRLKFWIESICIHVPPKAPIFLVGTHSGTVDRNCIETINVHLRRNLWDSYCDELIINDAEGLVFFPVENSDGKNDFGIQFLQNKIVDVADKCKEAMGRHLPLPWVRIQDAIINHKEKRDAKFCVTLEEFSGAFENVVCTDWSKDTLKYFHEKGLVIYLDKNQDLDLSNWVLLKPEILVDIIIQLVTPPPHITQERGLRRDWNLLQKKGMLTKSLLNNIISKVQEHEAAMTAFLEEYELICPLASIKVEQCTSDEQPTHFVPSLLPLSSEWDGQIWHDEATDKKCYVFFNRFLPEPLFHSLLSRAHKLSMVEFPNGKTFLFRDAGKFWFSAWQPYSLKLMKEEKVIEVTFSCRSNHQMRPSDVLCQVFSMVDGICKRNFPFVKFHCGPACPSLKCPGHQPDYLSYSTDEEQALCRHVFNIMPGRQGDRIAFLYCENCSFEEELDEWVP